MGMTFDQAWAVKESEGYQYGRDALEQVRFGWTLRDAEVAQLESALADARWEMARRVDNQELLHRQRTLAERERDEQRARAEKAEAVLADAAGILHELRWLAIESRPRGLEEKVKSASLLARIEKVDEARAELAKKGGGR